MYEYKSRGVLALLPRGFPSYQLDGFDSNNFLLTTKAVLYSLSIEN